MNPAVGVQSRVVGMSRRYRDEEYLHKQYVIKGNSIPEIADDCGVSSSTISRWLEQHGIEREPKYQQREWLREEYVEKRHTQQDIADECGVAVTTICHWLSRLGITDGESMTEGTCLTCGETFQYYPSVRDGDYCSNRCAKEPQKRQVEVVCEGCGEAFSRWQSLDTEYCSMSCWSEDNFPQDKWKEMYSGVWNKRRRQAIERDNHRCTVCGVSDEEHKRRFGRGLEVHHIVPAKLFYKRDVPTEDAHMLRNLVTVCRTHHPDAPGKTVESDVEFNR
jgi:5-methylcytosine-specific restriction endonuclease McrA